jgi:hypothetical protein
VRRYQLFAAGISAALLIGGVTSPVLASSGRITGSGRSASVAYFTIDVREDRPERGKLDYTSVDGRYKVRCRGFDEYTSSETPGPPAATVTAEDCELRGPRVRTTVEVEAEFVDNSSVTRKKDVANFTFTFTLPDDDDESVVTDQGAILSGDIKVR